MTTCSEFMLISSSTAKDKPLTLNFLRFLGPCGVLQGILGEGVPPGFPNADPISDQKMSFFTPVFRPGLYEIMPLLLRLKQ